MSFFANRRQLMSWVGIHLGLSQQTLSGQTAIPSEPTPATDSAPGQACTPPEPLLNRANPIGDLKSIQIGGEIPTVQYWINGPYIDESSESSAFRRANLALLIRHPQTSNEGFVERIVLAYDESKGDNREIAVQYFSQADQIDHHFPPYVIFNNVYIPRSENKIEVRYLLKGGQEEKVIRKVLPPGSQIRASRLRTEVTTNLVLPDTLNTMIQNSKHRGYISTPILISDKIVVSDLETYRFKAFFEKLTPENFTLTVLLPDLGTKNSVETYVRHVILTDPVGRVIAYISRPFPAPIGNKVQLTEQNEPLQGTTPGAPAFDSRYSAKVQNCPYCLVFIETQKAIFQQIISLR
ncbi:MAG: hypothetical protein OXT67_08505 [Zetaproteobacteria bacterium]|nr:hypothetical protein [Zetaproteobacteria bacterium]